MFGVCNYVILSGSDVKVEMVVADNVQHGSCTKWLLLLMNITDKKLVLTELPHALHSGIRVV